MEFPVERTAAVLVQYTIVGKGSTSAIREGCVFSTCVPKILTVKAARDVQPETSSTPQSGVWYGDVRTVVTPSAHWANFESPSVWLHI